MSYFGGRFPVQRPAAYGYDAAYEGVPNWDIGRPQRAFVEVAEAGLVRGPVLDVGCGTGELSLFLARQGHEVLGIDLAPRAIQQARQKARWRRIPASFLVWDARSDPARSYGISPAEVRDRFGGEGWEVAFVRPTTFERRYSTNAAYLAAVVRR